MADAGTSADMDTSKYASPDQGTPTVVDWKDFDADRDCEVLYKAFKGVGCDRKAVINVLCNRSNKQRQEIARAYQQMYGSKLIDKLKWELTGNMENVFTALMDKPEVLDARELRHAMKGAGTSEQVIVDVLCSRTNEQITLLKKAYNDKYNRSLEDDICSETSSDFRKILMSLLAGSRDQSNTVDKERAKADAQALYDAGEAKWGTNETIFNKIFGRQSYRQLQEVFNQYEAKFGRNILKVISKEFSGDIKRAHYALVSCVVNRQAYLAEVLYKSMKGMGTSDDRLIWVVVSQAEVDLEDIKKEFLKKYHETLEHWISADTSGDYKHALLQLCKGNKN